MTVGEFATLVKEHNIPEDVTLESDSGWECSETDMDGVYYNEAEKRIIFTQNGDEHDSRRWLEDGWKLIHSKEDK